MQTNFENLVRKYFSYISPANVLYNYRPDWLKYDSGNNLELDLYFPDIKFAIEVNGYHHKLRDIKKKDQFKREQCEKNGVYLLQLESPKYLLSKRVKNLINTYFGRIPHIPYSLINEILNYKLIQGKYSTKVNHIIKYQNQEDLYKELQDKENAFNKAKLARQT
jgi:hypothetical protein